MKRLLGAIVLPILWVLTWLRTPRDLNKNGLPDTTDQADDGQKET